LPCSSDVKRHIKRDWARQIIGSDSRLVQFEGA
jgi:hypothetical protein